MERLNEDREDFISPAKNQALALKPESLKPKLLMKNSGLSYGNDNLLDSWAMQGRSFLGTEEFFKKGKQMKTEASKESLHQKRLTKKIPNFDTASRNGGMISRKSTIKPNLIKGL